MRAGLGRSRGGTHRCTPWPEQSRWPVTCRAGCLVSCRTLAGTCTSCILPCCQRLVSPPPLARSLPWDVGSRGARLQTYRGVIFPPILEMLKVISWRLASSVLEAPRNHGVPELRRHSSPAAVAGCVSRTVRWARLEQVGNTWGMVPGSTWSKPCSLCVARVGCREP